MRRWSHLVMPCALLSPLVLLVVAQAVPGAALTVANGVHAVSVLVAGVAMVVAARSGDSRLRRARLWIGGALGASAVGFVINAVYAALVGQAPVVSLANLATLTWVPCALAGLLSIPTSEHRQGGRLRAVLDAVVVTTALTFLFWVLFLEPIYSRSELSGTEKTVLLAYPMVELVLAVVGVAVAGHVRPDMRRFLQLGVTGLLLVAVADSGGAVRIAEGLEGFSWANVVLQAGLVALLAAAVSPTATGPRDGSRRAAVADAVLPHAPVVVVAVVGLARTVSGRPLETPETVFSAVMVLGLVARQVLYASHLSAIAHRLSVEAARDPLTGLHNRRSCLTALDASLAELDAGRVVVVLVDLDGFKEVNDSFGHAAGDVALIDFARRLADTADETTTPARLGGDEFALLVVGDDAEARALLAADALTRGQRSRIGAVTVSVGASAGIAVSRSGETSSGLLRRADLAMYEAKRTARSRAAVFTDDMAHRAERRHLLAQALPGAAARGELDLVYQPLFHLADGTLAGAEALLRWHHPLHGSVPPLEFIPLAEDTGAIDDVGRWALRRAAHDLAAWSAAGRPLPRLFVNVSSRQLTEGFADTVSRVFADPVSAPSAVTIEITESAMPGLQASRCLEQLRAGGFSLAMDDFGAGFSSLAQLGVLPVDTVKFDREFLRGVQSANGRRIVDAFISLAGDLGLTTVAEGIESAAEAEVVRRAGCTLAQGNHFAPPMPAAELSRLLEHCGAVPIPRPAAEPAGRAQPPRGAAAPAAGSSAVEGAKG